MKILYITTGELNHFDAPAYHVAGFCNALADLGHEITAIYVCRKLSAKSLLSSKVKARPIWIPRIRGAIRLLSLLLSIRLLDNRLKRYNIAIIRVIPHELILKSFFRLKIPGALKLIGQEHAFYPVFKKYAEKFTVIYSDSMPTILLLANAWAILISKFILSETGISPEYFIKLNEGEHNTRRRLHEENNLFSIVHVSSFRPHHDFETILKAIKGLNFNCRIIFIGDGLRKKEVMLRASELHVNALFVGSLPLSEAIETMACADICINALKAWSQKVGNFRAFKLYEYMAAEIPTIETIDPALEVPAWAEECLGLVPYENPYEMKKMITEIRENPEIWRQKAEKARSWVLNNRSWQKVAQKMIDGFVNKLEDSKKVSNA